MNQFRICLRNLARHRRYVIPNILGLGVAIATLLIITQFASFQLSFDRFYEHDLYRVINAKYQNGEPLQKTTVTYSAVGPAMAEAFPEVERQSRIFPFGNAIVHSEGQDSRTVYRCVAVEQDFFAMFEMSFIAGNQEVVFQEPNQLVLTRSTARKIFPGREDYAAFIGQIVKLDNDPDLYTISGIVEDMPENAHLSYNLFMSYPTIVQTWGIPQAAHDWNMIDFRHYVQLRPGTDVAVLNEKLANFGQYNRSLSDTDYDRFELEAVEDIYLSTQDLAYEIALHGDRQIVYGVLGLGFLLFIVSWINFVNLNSSLALERAKTIGIRKVLGASQPQLKTGLALDITLIYLLSLVLGLALSLAATDLFRHSGYEVKPLGELVNGQFLYLPLWALLFALFLSGALLAYWLYVRINLAPKDSEVIRVRSDAKTRGSGKAGHALLVIQFVLSLTAFGLGMIIYQQQQHIRGTDLGFDLENLWVIQQPKLSPGDSSFEAKMSVFKTQLLSDPAIRNVTTNQRTPGQQVQVDYEAKVGEQKGALAYLMTDETYLELYEMELLTGRNFRPEETGMRWNLARHIIINEQSLGFLGVSSAEEAIGKRIELLGQNREVIGVMRNYRQQPVMYNVQPLALLPVLSPHHQIVLKTAAGLDDWLGQTERLYHDFFPGNPFEYRDLKAEYEAQYASVRSMSQAMGTFTLLTVLISLFGMLAMAFLNLLSRLREFGIRKVLGATHRLLYFGVLRLYLQLFTVAFLVAIPATVFLARKWLSQFTEQIELSPIFIAVPGLIIAGLIGLVIYFISHRVIRSNPAEVLRSE